MILPSHVHVTTKPIHMPGHLTTAPMMTYKPMMHLLCHFYIKFSTQKKALKTRLPLKVLLQCKQRVGNNTLRPWLYGENLCWVEGSPSSPPPPVNFSESLYEKKVNSFAWANSTHACFDFLKQRSRVLLLSCLDWVNPAGQATGYVQKVARLGEWQYHQKRVTRLMGHSSCRDFKLHVTVCLYLFCWYFYIRELSFIVTCRGGVEGVRMLNVLLDLIECRGEGRVEIFCRHVHGFCPPPLLPSSQVIVTES